MESDFIQILFTRPIDQEDIDDAAKHKIRIDVIPFIDTVPVNDVQVGEQIKELAAKKIVVVFTSMNAAEIVGKQLPDHHQWDVYCLGTATKEVVATYFGHDSVVGTGDDAKDLARKIAADNAVTEVFFFCGEQRREELPEILRNAGIKVNEIAVYQTIELKNAVDKVYQGVAFFSPSAVRSFFSSNSINHQTILFAIGNTTAEEIRKHTSNEVVISDRPGKYQLLEKILSYYKQQVQE